MATAALGRDLNVLCEAGGADLYRRSGCSPRPRRNLALTGGHALPLHRSHAGGQNHVNHGFFGRIYAARVWQRRNGIPGCRVGSPTRTWPAAALLLDIGVHTLDRALYLMNYPQPARVTGVTFASRVRPTQARPGRLGFGYLKPSANTRYDVDDVAWAQVGLCGRRRDAIPGSLGSELCRYFSSPDLRHRGRRAHWRPGLGRLYSMLNGWKSRPTRSCRRRRAAPTTS